MLGVFDPRGHADPRLAARATRPGRRAAALGPMQLVVGEAADLSLDAGRLAIVEGRVELEGRPGALDAAALAAAFSDEGAALARRLRGGFRAAVWDERRAEGMLVRDPVGRGSLFLASSCPLVRWAGEIHDLLDLLPARPGPDVDALLTWLAERPGWHERTLFEGITPMAPLTALRLDARGAHPVPAWRPVFREPERLGIDEAADRVRAAATRALGHDRGSGPFAVALSGGIDSSSVAAFAAEALSGEPLDAVSTVHPGVPETDEESLILETASALELRSHRLEVVDVSPLASGLLHLARWQVPPPTPATALNTAVAAHARSLGASTILTGGGGDELFELSPWLLADEVARGRPDAAWRVLQRVGGAATAPLRLRARYFVRYGVGGALPVRLATGLRRPRSDWFSPPEWIAPEHAERLRAQDDPHAWRRLDGPRWWASQADLLIVGRQRMRVHDVLRHIYASAGLVDRHPLLDLEMVETVLALPPQLAFDPRHSRPVQRHAVRGRVPDSVRLRSQKAIFDPVLDAFSARHDGDRVHRALQDPAPLLRSLVAVDRLEHDVLHARAGTERGIALWGLVMADAWLREQEDPGWAARTAQTLPSREVRER
jgi:asparagine synthase (glutamine-hydrolysing)